MTSFFYVVRMDLDFCQETFGVAPCTATGTPCYQTIDSCTDETNFNKGAVRHWFTRHNGPLLLNSVTTHRAIQKINPKLGAIDPQSGLGGRDTVDIDLDDFMGLDINEDPSRLTRGVTIQNTFARKLIARNRHHKGRPVYIYKVAISHGIVGAVLETYEYRIERILLTAKGWRIEAKDLASPIGDTKTPKETTHSLDGDINTSVTSLSLQTGEGASYSAGSTIRIDDEIMDISAVVSDTLTVSRGDWGSDADEHDDETRAQKCHTETDAEIGAAWGRLLTSEDAANIDSGSVDVAAATTESNLLYKDQPVTFCLSEPDNSDDVDKQYVAGLNAYMYSSAQEGKIKFKLSRPSVPSDTIDSFTDAAHVLENMPPPIPIESRRYTRVIVYYGVVNWAKKITTFDKDKPNFRRAVAYIKSDEEGVNRYNESKTLRVFAWMLPATGGTTAQSIASRLLNRYTKAPIQQTWTVLASDAENAHQGDTCKLSVPETCDFDGVAENLEYLVLSRKEATDGTPWVILKAETTRWDNKYGMYAPDDVLTNPAYTDEQKAAWANYADATGKLGDGSEGYRYI